MVNLLLLLAALVAITDSFANGYLSALGASTLDDPAPGRSPGPPEVLTANGGNDELIDLPTILLNNGNDDRSKSLCSLPNDAKGNNAEVPLSGNGRNVLNITISHKLFKTDVIVAGIKYQVHLENLQPTKSNAVVDFVITSKMNGELPMGDFSSNNGFQEYNCEPHVFRSQLKSSDVMLNWTLQSNKEFLRSNITFQLYYKVNNEANIYGIAYTVPATKVCDLTLKLDEATVSHKDLLNINNDCQVWFPVQETGHGLVVELTRLNVPCSRGWVHFTGLNLTAASHQQQQHFRNNHKQARMCGKLEELPEADRHIYFPSSHIQPYMRLHGNPVFMLAYHLVDYCYNVTFVSRNGSFELKPNGELQCTFKIFLPYGNRVAMTLQIGDSTSTGTPETVLSFEDKKSGESTCQGLLTELHDGSYTWSHCTKPGGAERQIEIVSRENRVVLKVSVRSGGNSAGGLSAEGSGGALGLRMTYRAEPLEAVVGVCDFGWVAVRQFCVSAIEGVRLPWAQAETECVKRGGHLASIRSEHDQSIVDNLLLNSPGYRDHNAYWIGASDKAHEGDFRWSDGLPFSYTNWFPGWAQHGHYNKQPNDDGLSEQDCVEVRRIYSLPTSSTSLATTFMWNDRDCSTPNYFICERLQSDEPLEENWPPDCNKSVQLSRQQPRAVVSSPGFPRQYPDNAACDTDITAPPGYRLILDFEELVIENEPSCSYDFLEIWDNSIVNSTSANMLNGKSNNATRRLCGDWSSKLKLLRYVSNGSKLKLRFTSDYSHHFGGFKARISMESAMQCADDRYHMFNNSCYLIISYPEVTWATAQQICRGVKANLASVLSPEEQRFLTTHIRKTAEYRTSELYWLGAKADYPSEDFKWIDGNAMTYFGWLPGEKANKHNDIPQSDEKLSCLGIQWTASPSPALPSGMYWKREGCSRIGGYVCKRRHQLLGNGINFNQTLNGTEGNLTTPNYPGNYYNNLDFSVRISGPDRTRLVIEFKKIDIEPQLECLYDYIELRTVYRNGGGRQPKNEAIKWCGNHDIDMHRFNFVSETNEVEITFHSDYSISASGFFLVWHAVDVSACPMQTLTAKEGIITSPNYPHFLLAHLDCTITIQAPAGKRVWLDFTSFDNDSIDLMAGNNNKQHNDVLFELSLGKQLPPFKPFEVENLLTEGTFVSTEERLRLRLRTGDRPQGKGFRVSYRIINLVKEEKIISFSNYSNGLVLHLNYPDSPPSNVDFLQHFVAPLGHVISLELYYVKLTDSDCDDGNGVIEVYDNYSDGNGTTWNLCYDPYADDSLIPIAPLAITSYLNTLHLRQKGGILGIPLNGTVRVQLDNMFRIKVLNYKEEKVDSCHPNPCQNHGKCISKNSKSFCKCIGHFTGLFCTLNQCELEPCIFGTCELTNTSFKCHCKSGYIGPTCEQKRRPCEGNPCESRGTCIEKGNGFICQCHAWWEGPRCEKKMHNIPYKPLSERMLHEPFWLGLMTVFVVMGVIGLVWCAKRHFPEKIEKLLAEESERNRSTMSSLRSASVREQLAAASGATASVTVTPSPGTGAQRSLFGRLGIRKPSILSLTSPHASGYAPATARTFSLDDLLKPPPRRTPSPKKKRNNSTPTKKNVAEKKQILQQLISPGNKHTSRKVSLGELMQMSERKGVENEEQIKQNQSHLMKETAFADNDPAQTALSDPKLEKKVTFARLLNKVSAEMSSGSEMELGIMQTNRLGCMFARPSSTPPSPGVDARSPNSTSSNQDLLNNKRRLPNGRQKPASADSILAMFRNFSSSSAGVNLPSSLKVTPSTTPTASSPQDDLVGDDESSTSSVYTPVSFTSSGPPESPIMHRSSQSTIEVPVLDPLSAHKSSSSGSNFLHPPTILLEIPSTINKCLSPIREMPTPLPSPMPSPALTPVMRRSTASSSLDDADNMSDDRMSIELPNISISCSDPEDEVHCSDIAIDPQAEDGFILEEAAAMQRPPHYKTKNRPPPLGQPSENQRNGEITITIEPPPLVIPTLTIQTPSPTHSKSPTKSFPGSPPPHKAQEESCFQFPSPKPSRKLFKDFDKPTSLDLPCAPPMITITCNMSEAESDGDAMSPAPKSSAHMTSNPSGMTYLSPFSMGTRGEHTASESNLSSSGYSSMASPGPSRCGSSNPLCPSEMEDQGPPGAGCIRRRSLTPIIKPSNNESSSTKKTSEQQHNRGRSDSETLSDDPQLESNDEGIGTDHIEEKIDEGEVKSAKELKVFMGDKEGSTSNLKVLLDLPILSTTQTPRIGKCISLEDNIEKLVPPPSSTGSKNSLLQLPSIVIQCDSPGCEKHLSPMSSRSESPLSDRTTGMGRFSPQFYGRHKDLLPFTDSDGLYDFPSTDKVNVYSGIQHKKTSKRREKKLTRNCKTPSPTKTHQSISPYNHLDVPSKDSFYKVPPPRKLSPKRRVARSQVVSSSSSSDSINSVQVKLSSSSPSPDTIRWSSPVAWLVEEKYQKSHEASEEEEDVNTAMLAKSPDLSKHQYAKHQKISRLRAISHQIRFLRRLELSLKRRERTISPSDSLDSEEESPQATSPLLQPSSKGPKVEIRKSSSISKLQNSSTTAICKNRRGKYKRGDFLLPQSESSLQKIIITGSGHSD